MNEQNVLDDRTSGAYKLEVSCPLQRGLPRVTTQDEGARVPKSSNFPTQVRNSDF